jgi:hypothetical protein
MKTFDTAGLAASWWGFVDPTTQRFLGAATTLANGADSSAVELKGLFSQDINPPALRTVATKGNNGFISEFIFPAEGGPQGTIQLGQFDANFYALTQGNKIYSLDNDHELVMIQPTVFDLKRLCLIFNANANAQDVGYAGNPGFIVDIYPNVRLMPTGGSGMRSAQDSNFTWRAVANAFDKFPWGESLSNSNQGTLGACGFRFFSPYPICMHAHKGDGSDVAFTLSKTPASADADKLGIWNNSASKLAYTSGFTASAKVVTLASAPSAAYNTTVMYEYDLNG